MVPILILLNLLQRYISNSIKFIQIDLYLTILTIAMCLLDFSEFIQYTVFIFSGIQMNAYQKILPN